MSKLIYFQKITFWYLQELKILKKFLRNAKKGTWKLYQASVILKNKRTSERLIKYGGNNIIIIKTKIF